MTTPLPLSLLPSSPMSFSDAIKKAKVADAATGGMRVDNRRR